MPDIKEIVASPDQGQREVMVLDDGEQKVDTDDGNILQLPCEHTNFGCPKMLSLNLKLAHEAFCDFQPCKCPFPDSSEAECSWKGLPGKLLSHVADSHQMITIFNAANATLRATDVNVQEESNWFLIQKCYARHFILILRKKLTPERKTQYVAYAQLIGTRRQAKQYYYELECPGIRRSIKWQAKTRSLFAEDGSKEKSECLMFDSSTAELFILNGIIVIHCSIRRKFQV